MKNKIIDATTDEVQTAKESAISLVQGSIVQQTAEDLFYTDNLEEVEHGLKSLNEFSNKAWLLSAIVLYTVIYNNELYTQSGLSWDEYSKQARERIGIEQRDISEQLSSARFFIQHHKELERKGFDPSGNNRKLARAELATELSGDVHAVIEHLVNDSWAEKLLFPLLILSDPILTSKVKKFTYKVLKQSKYPKRFQNRIRLESKNILVRFLKLSAKDMNLQ